MKRDLALLAEREHDLLIVGGGIHGAAAAWDASQRGLRVALAEARDFGGGVSWNSLKTIHGGIRHLQRADIRGVRESVRERRALMRIAPRLVRPLSFLIPTYGHGFRGREALRAALLANDLIGLDRNRGLPAGRCIPAGRGLSRREVLELVPGFPEAGLTGGVAWTDAQVTSGERLILGFLHAACFEGAALANHLEVTRLLRSGSRIVGALARDAIAGVDLEIRARAVLNASGPGLDQALAQAGLPAPAVPWLLATNVVLSRVPTGRLAAGVFRGGRYLFLVPWEDRVIVGTAYDPPQMGDGAAAEFFEDARQAFAWARIERSEVCLVHQGLVPGGGGRGLWTRHRIVDHEEQDGVGGLVSIQGVKYTTARGVAEQAVDRIVRRLGCASKPCRTAETVLEGAAPIAGSLEQRTRTAVRDEMALLLSDAVLRRLDLGTSGPPADEDVRRVGSAMATELGWEAERAERERRELAGTYRLAEILRTG